MVFLRGALANRRRQVKLRVGGGGGGESRAGPAGTESNFHARSPRLINRTPRTSDRSRGSFSFAQSIFPLRPSLFRARKTSRVLRPVRYTNWVILGTSFPVATISGLVLGKKTLEGTRARDKLLCYFRRSSADASRKGNCSRRVYILFRDVSYACVVGPDAQGGAEMAIEPWTLCE